MAIARAENREGVGDRARRLREHRAQRARMRDGLGGGGRERARRRPSFAAAPSAERAASPSAPPTLAARRRRSRRRRVRRRWAAGAGTAPAAQRRPPACASGALHPPAARPSSPAPRASGPRSSRGASRRSAPWPRISPQARHPREKLAAALRACVCARRALRSSAISSKRATDLGERERRLGLLGPQRASASRSPRRSRLRR